MTTTYPLPQSVQELADVVGREDALKLVMGLPRIYSACHPSGRSVVYVPTSIRPEHVIAQLIGWEQAVKLARIFGGTIIRPARCFAMSRQERDAAIREMLAKGHTTTEAAECFGISDRHIRNIAREIPEVSPPAANDNNRAA